MTPTATNNLIDTYQPWRNESNYRKALTLAENKVAENKASFLILTAPGFGNGFIVESCLDVMLRKPNDYKDCLAATVLIYGGKNAEWLNQEAQKAELGGLWTLPHAVAGGCEYIDIPQIPD